MIRYSSHQNQNSGNSGRQKRTFQTSRNQQTAASAGSRLTAVIKTQKINGPSFARFRGEETKLRVAVIGGLEEVGRNCTMFEYNNDIIIIDMGLQFPEEDMPGIDYIIPNMGYMKGKEKNIRGVVITHAHYDHIGGIPHCIPMLGYPPIYGLPLTNAIIKKRQEDYKGLRPLNIHDLNLKDKLTLGSFEL
mgnify:FL=1